MAIEIVGDDTTPTSQTSDEVHTSEQFADVVATSGKFIMPTSPMVNESLQPFPESLSSDVAVAFNNARRAQREWASTPIEKRASIMRSFVKQINKERDLLLDVIQRETGKSRLHANDELLHVMLNAEYYASHTQKVLSDQSRKGAFPVITSVQVSYHPKGVVGIICPWNYPFSLALCDAIPALMAGNAVVIKPDVQGMWSAIHAVRLLRAAGLPAGLVQLVSGDGPSIGGALVDQADYLCFTGSTRTGRIVATQAAQRLVGMSLELGGKNPMVVCADANLKTFLDVAVRSCFTSAGQLCVSTERIFIHRDIHERFVSALVERVSALTLGANLGWGYEVGSLNSQIQHDRVATMVKDAVASGARVLTGGKSRPDIGPFVYEPTILVDVTPEMNLHSQEVFGPCVYVESFANYDDVIARVNASEYGLSASVLTSDKVFGQALARELHCGSVNINEGFATAFASVDAPMGGMGISGVGRRHGPEGLLRFVEPQTLATQVALSMGNVARRPDQQWARWQTLALRLLSYIRLR